MFSLISDQTFIFQRLQRNLHQAELTQAELTQGRLDSRADLTSGRVDPLPWIRIRLLVQLRSLEPLPFCPSYFTIKQQVT